MRAIIFQIYVTAKSLNSLAAIPILWTIPAGHAISWKRDTRL